MNLNLNLIEPIDISSNTGMPLHWCAGDELRRIAIDCEILQPFYREGAALHAVLEAVQIRLTSRDSNDAVLRSNYLRFMDQLMALAADDRLLAQDREVLQAGLHDVGRLRCRYLSPNVQEEVKAFYPFLNFGHRNLSESLSQRALTDFRAFRDLHKLGTGGQAVADFLATVMDESKTPRHMRGWGIHRVIARLPGVPKYAMKDLFLHVMKAVRELGAPRLQCQLTTELAGTIDMTCNNARHLWMQCLELLVHVAEAHPPERVLNEELLRSVNKLRALKLFRPWFDNWFEFIQYGKRFSKAGYVYVALALRTAATLNFIATHNSKVSAWATFAVLHFRHTAVSMLVNPCKGPEVIKLFEALEKLHDLLEGAQQQYAQMCMVGMLPWAGKSSTELGERLMSKLRGTRDKPGLDLRMLGLAAMDQLPNVLLLLLNWVEPERLPRWLDCFIQWAKLKQCPEGEFMVGLARRIQNGDTPLSADDWQRLNTIAGEYLEPLRNPGDRLLGRKQFRSDTADSVRTILDRAFETHLSALWRETPCFDANIKKALGAVLGASLGSGEAFERAWQVFDGKQLVRAQDFIHDFSAAMSGASTD